jgi:hypothetical protein
MIVRSFAYLCDRTHLSLFLLCRVPVLALDAVVCERTFLTNNSAVIRSIAPLLQSSALAYTTTYLHVCDRSYCLALKQTSADCTNIPEAVCSIFISFSFD